MPGAPRIQVHYLLLISLNAPALHSSVGCFGKNIT